MDEQLMSNVKALSEAVNLGIFIGVSQYESPAYEALPACDKDVELMHAVAIEIKKFDKAIILKNEKSSIIKDQIISLIEEYKGRKINEIVFYFSGHGERVEEQYYYVLNDFQEQRKNSTGLSEDYLDGLIREAKPRVFTKIIDACFSGTKYIKDSRENKERILQKQAGKLELENIYYFFSSRDNQASYADRKGMSYFTDQLISCILDQERDVRYIDLSKELADAFSADSDTQQPIFVMQGSYLDGFGKISTQQISQLMNKIGFKTETTAVPEKSDEKNESHSLAEKLKAISVRSGTICFDEKTIESLLGGFQDSLEKSIPKYVKDAFDLNIDNSTVKFVPNKEQIGDWLSKKNNLFAFQTYSSRAIIKKEYVKPEKIIVKNKNDSIDDLFGLTSRRMESLFSRRHQEEELVLKDVKVNERYISGFEYTSNYENNIFKIELNPKLQLLPKVSLWVVFIYSDKEFYAHYSHDILQKKSWQSYVEAKCKKWSVLNIKDIKKIKNTDLAKHFASEILEILDKVTQQSIPL